MNSSLLKSHQVIRKMKTITQNQQQNKASHPNNQWKDIDLTDEMFQPDIYKSYINSSSSTKVPYKSKFCTTRS